MAFTLDTEARGLLPFYAILVQLHTFTVLRQNALTFTLPPPYGERKQYMYSKYDYEIASRCDALCSEVEDRAVHSNHAEPEALWAARRLGGASASREGRPRLIPYPFHVLPGYSAPACPSPAPRPRAPRGGLSGTVYYGLRYPRHRYAGPGGHADTRWPMYPWLYPHRGSR